jgi:hypothetical protein
VKEDMRGSRLRSKGSFFFSTGKIFGGFSWIVQGSFEFCSREGLVQGHRFAGGFGHGGQDIHMVSWS